MTTVMRLGALGCAALLLIFSCGVPGLAQAQNTPALTIKVTDPTGAVIPNASVTLTRGNEERTLQADSNGVVEAPGLSTGEWSLAVKGTGFATKQRPVIMQGIAQSVTVILELAPLRQNVLVEGVADPPSPVQLNATAAGGSYLDVSVRELPFNLTVIDQDFMRERGVTNLMDALELVPGVTTWADTGWIPAVDIRGLSTTDAGIFMANEGIVQNSVPQSGRNIDTFFIDRVEVLKGPSSFSYGTGTAGASINTFAKEPRRELGMDSMFSYGSYGQTRVGFGITGPLTKSLSGDVYLVNNHTGTNVQRTHSTMRAANTGLTWNPLEWLTVKYKGTYNMDDTSPYFSTPILNRRVDPNAEYIELAYNTFLDPRARSLNYNMVNAVNDSINKRGTVTTEVDLPFGWKLQNRTYIATQHLDSINNEGASFSNTTLRVTPSGYTYIFRRDRQIATQFDLRNTFRFWGRSASVAIGGRVDDNDQGRYGASTTNGAAGTPPAMDYLSPIEFRPNHTNFQKTAIVDTVTKNGFFEGMFRVTKKLTFSGGTRIDHIRNNRLTIASGLDNLVSFHAVTGRYAVTYDLFPTVTLYLGNSKAIQPAGTGVNSTGAIALNGITASQAQFQLQPSRGWEGGVKASAWREKIQGTLSYFNMRKHNIVTQELQENGTILLERAGKALSEGVDTSFVVRPIRMFALMGDFVWNNGQYLVFHSVSNGVETDRSGNKLPRTPTVQWSVTPTLTLGPVTGSIQLRVRGATWSDNNNTQRVPQQHVINSNVSFSLAKGFRVTLTARNLDDEILINRGGIVTGATTARIGLPRNYSMQITRKF